MFLSFLLLFFLPSIQTAPVQPQAVIVTPPPVDLKEFYKDHIYVVPVEVPYKVKLPSKAVIQLGLQDALKTFEEQKISVGKAPSQQDIPSGGLTLEAKAGSYLWSNQKNNNNVILAIHHEQPFELDFHLKSLDRPPNPQPQPAPAPPPPVPVPSGSGTPQGSGTAQAVPPQNPLPGTP